MITPCPYCHANLEHTEAWCGHSVACPSCNQTVHIGELEPPASVLPHNNSPPPLLSRVSKPKRGVAIVVGLACLGMIVLFIVANVPSPEKNDVHEPVVTQNQASPAEVAPQVDPNEPMSSPKYGLKPIPIKLQNKLIEALTETDELDAMIKRGCSFEEYAVVFVPFEGLAQQLQDALPSTDPRMHIFLASYERYQLLTVKLKKNASKDELSDADLFASLPKAFLLKILNGTLDENEQQIFNDMKQQIKSGTLYLQ